MCEDLDEEPLTYSRLPQQEQAQPRLLALLPRSATPATQPACHPLLQPLQGPALRPGQGLFLQTRA
jgi:hypothetical protein